MVPTRSALGKTVLVTPLVIVVAAKRNDFEQSWAQCLAELVAVQMLNKGQELPVYGIVTDGKSWEFGQLQRKTFTQHHLSFNTEPLNNLFGAVGALFEVATK